ncbi:MAG TPA: metallophosphoesterase [Intrasporangium sp.]|uniref:metallophosphoesterase family protein n=1 Tax=Intrasporangium sp. TaxID=1925024 RepID=UPI002D77A388|nr:metallophosphoesterase [Intrasporangium sp.]HET7397174.1 metallophosphoesterase [Intrasporangium sp.]
MHTTHYQAVLRLDPVPGRTPVLHAPTIIGDVDVAFLSPLVAPGLDVAVSVREGITDLITRSGVSVRTLQPSGEELSAAIRSAGIGVGARFVVGALLVAAALSVSAHYARRRLPVRHHVVVVGSAVAATCLLTGASTALTYSPSRFAAYSTTGVLGTVQRNAGMLAGLEARAAQATPYLRNLLAVSQALQEKFVPGELSQPVAARFLLVSDVHGANQYSLMRTIIAEEQVDAVIDAGDLLNFGRVTEGEAAGVFRGIASLGVPYIFVRGNHDAAAPDDRAVLTRMARIPNVVLLQDAEGRFTELGFHGLRITGVGDPRYFGDDNQDPRGKERPAVEAFNRAMAGEPEPDLVVTHEPYAAEQVDRGRILVHGHMHSAAVEGHRIQVGTFTGGGVVSHFVERDGAELTGQPYAFDVATFGSRCTLTQLTRYTYRNLLEGRPAYDTVQVVNGATIDPLPAAPAPAAGGGAADAAPAGEQRTCSRLEPTSRRVVTAPPANGPTPPSTGP